MAITPILLADDGSASLTKINDNFSFLDTDKASTTGVQTFTNKTIDANLNTILNIGFSELDSGTLFTGSASTLVSGTAGVSPNIAQWSASGDLTDSGAAVDADTSLGGATPSNTKISTQLAVKTYVDGVSGITQVIQPTGGFGATTATVGNEINVLILNNAADYVSFSFAIPGTTAFTIQKVELYLTHNTTSGTDYTLDTFADWAGNGQSFDAASGSALGVNTGALNNKEVSIVDVTSAFAGAASGDLVTLKTVVNAATGAALLGVHKLVVTLA